MNCPICNSERANLIARRQPTPVLMHQLFATEEEARHCSVGSIELVRCEDCGFARNRAFDPELIVYAPGYDNDQLNSQVFRDHVDDMIALVREEMAVFSQSACVVEVGTGQGRFLERLKDIEPGIGRALGFDPAYRGADGPTGSGVELYRRYYDPDVARDIPHVPDLVVSRHTIEHVPEPLSFLRSIRDASLRSGRTVRLLIETPDIQWIVDNAAFEDVFYEHCSIFDPASLHLAMQKIGCSDIEVISVFGSQYLWASGTLVDDRADESDTSIAFSTGSRSIGADVIAQWKTRLQSLSAVGPVVVWGAGAKGMSFCQLLDPAKTEIAALVDINDRKVGKFIGMSGHQVRSPESIAEIAPRTIIVMNPNYREEITRTAAELGCNANIVTLHGLS